MGSRTGFCLFAKQLERGRFQFPQAGTNFDLAGLTAGDYEVIDEKITYRLAQKPGAYVILKYVHTVIKHRQR